MPLTLVSVRPALTVEGIGVDERNRELVVAVLAVLTDAISRDDFIAALKSWSPTQQTSLALALKQASGLDDETYRTLESLAKVQLKVHQNDVGRSLDSLNARDLTIEMLTEIDQGNLRMTLSRTLECDATVAIDQVPGPSPGSPDSSPRFPGNEGDRFQRIRPHASGGIGQIWVARDSQLQRDVALKEIQPQFAERADQRARFLLEAEITGNLEHPGIVPVYSLGKDAEGRPYYAMRFIRGESLSVAIQRFHRESPETSGFATTQSRRSSKWGIAFRKLLGRYLDVCDAIGYAHSRGVLHRDLKPANIMLGHYGETLVVDWGVAKVIGEDDVVPLSPEGEAATDALNESGTMRARTEHGTLIGTPAYMSPEQVRGLIDELGPASDVYSLGATLYELLTGQTAFRQEKLSVMMQKVLAADFRPPRRHRPLDYGATRGDLFESHGHRCIGAVRLGSRTGSGSRALAGRRAGRGSPRAAVSATRAVDPPAPSLGLRGGGRASGYRGRRQPRRRGHRGLPAQRDRRPQGGRDQLRHGPAGRGRILDERQRKYPVEGAGFP